MSQVTATLARWRLIILACLTLRKFFLNYKPTSQRSNFIDAKLARQSTLLLPQFDGPIGYIFLLPHESTRCLLVLIPMSRLADWPSRYESALVCQLDCEKRPRNDHNKWPTLPLTLINNYNKDNASQSAHFEFRIQIQTHEANCMPVPVPRLVLLYLFVVLHSFSVFVWFWSLATLFGDVWHYHHINAIVLSSILIIIMSSGGGGCCCGCCGCTMI